MRVMLLMMMIIMMMMMMMMIIMVVVMVVDRSTYVYYRGPCARLNCLCPSLKSVSCREKNVSVSSVPTTSRNARSARSV